MTLRSCAWQNPYNNPSANPIGEQNKLAGPQTPAKRSDIGNNKASIFFEALIPLFVLLIKDFFTKFIKVFIEST